jgi:DNA-binding HxlR family transcriptional regulator
MSPRHTGALHDNCVALREVLNRVGDKWSILVVSLLNDGPRRFSELRRSIEGISQRMLTLTLKGLERDGLVTRTMYPTIPPRVDYELTRVGRTLLEPVMALAAWAEKNRGQIQAARDRFAKVSERKRKVGERATG